MDLAHISFEGVQPASCTDRPLVARRPRATDAHRRTRDDENNARLATWILTQSGIDHRAYRQAPVQRRVNACLRWLQVGSPEQAYDVLAQSMTLLPYALNTILIGVSGFFRDPAVFDRLRRELLPALLVRRNGLRVLSAGSSRGEELYSVGMLLDELKALDHSELLGVDCRRDALECAAAGLFDESQLNGLPAVQRKTYLSPMVGGHGVIGRLRNRCTWRCADLLSFDDGISRHLILFRNVAIYLRPEAAVPVWERLCARLEPGGILVTGKGEQPPASLPLTRIAQCLYRRL